MAGFATDIRAGDGALPAILGKPESEYYRLRSDPPAPPTEGCILLTRIPYTRMLKVHLANGDTHRLLYGKDTNDKLVREYGVPREKVEAVMDYLWSFYKMYVKVEPVESPTA